MGSRRGSWWLPLAEADLRRVHLYDPAGPIYRGGYARLDLDLGLSGFVQDDLDIEVTGGPEVGMMSESLEHPPNPGTVIVVAGPHPGTYPVEARLKSGGRDRDREIEIVDYWQALTGPSKAFTGKARLLHPGWRPGGAQCGTASFRGPTTTACSRPSAPAASRSSWPTQPAYPRRRTRTRTSVARSSTRYPTRGSRRASRTTTPKCRRGRLTMSLAGLVQVNLNHPWVDYFQVIKHPSGGKPINVYRRELIDDAVWEAAEQADLRTVDTLLVVVPSPNGAQPQSMPPPLDPVTQFAWPVSSGGTFMWGGSGLSNDLQLDLEVVQAVVMPSEWTKPAPRTAYSPHSRTRSDTPSGCPTST